MTLDRPAWSARDRVRIACCSDAPDPTWHWIANDVDSSIFEWTFFSARPRNAIERIIQRPRLSRYRACREAAAHVVRERPDLLVTHHPLVTAWTEAACRGRTCPHVAFAFNFTHLPKGPRNWLIRRALASVDRFVVFSHFERRLYSDFFRIPEDRFDMVHWGVHRPQIGMQPEARGEYVCAVGSQARDYQTLIAAMRRLPEIPLTIVAHPKNIRGLALPDNVTVRLNIPLPEAQSLIARSRFVVLPLATSETPCGHVTIVTAMHLGKALVASDSIGIRDYIADNSNGVCVPPRDPAALAAAIRRLWNDPTEVQRLGQSGAHFAAEKCSERTTVDYFNGLVEQLGIRKSATKAFSSASAT